MRTGLVDGNSTLNQERFALEVYKVSSRDIISESFDGDIVVVDLTTGRYFSMSRSAGALWQMLSSGAAPAAIAAAAAAAGRDPAIVATFADILCGHGLLSRIQGGASSEPDAAAIAQFVGAADIPEIDVFDDLADLFSADPIHDVEEPAGWPVLKQV